MNGCSLGEPRLNEESKTLVQIWIVTTNTSDKKKELGVQRAWT
jgi:hypothetical protein